jgi:hypothetical protein
LGLIRKLDFYDDMADRSPKQEGPLGEREYEVWADDQYPPYILLLYREERDPPAYVVTDPRENNKVVFSSHSYHEVCLWLSEDEFGLVEARMKVLEWWEQFSNSQAEI